MTARNAAVWQASVDLAAAFRFVHRIGFSEGICNLFSAEVPGHPDLFLLNPQGLHWSEIRASDLIIVDSGGNLVEGKYKAELTAFYIHSRIKNLCAPQPILLRIEFRLL